MSTELLTPFAETAPPPARLILPVTFANGLQGNAHGVEIIGDLRPVAWWRATANYSFLRVQMTRNPGSADVSQEGRYEGLSPQLTAARLPEKGLLHADGREMHVAEGRHVEGDA